MAETSVVVLGLAASFIFILTMRKGKGEDFAVNHLRQKGWSEGEGLGRGGHGMAEAIKPKLKFDNSGLGHDRGEEFTFNWWEHVFNKAAQNVQVEEDQAG